MIARDLPSSTTNQVRIDTYYFRLIFVLVIPQIETSIVFVIHLRLHIVPDIKDRQKLSS